MHLEMYRKRNRDAFAVLTLKWENVGPHAVLLAHDGRCQAHLV